MSYLNSVDGITTDFKQAVISLWFRVPQESITKAAALHAQWRAAARAASDAGGFIAPPPFSGIVPLLTFGSDTLIRSYTFHNVPAGSYLYRTLYYDWGTTCSWLELSSTTLDYPRMEWYFDGKQDYRSEPSYVGIDCKPDKDTGAVTPKLAICLQMPDTANMSGSSMVSMKSRHIPDYDFYGNPNTGWFSGSPCGGLQPEGPNGEALPIYGLVTNTFVYESAAPVILGKQKEVFRTLPLGDTVTSGGKDVAPDHWHHVLVSLDLTQACTTTGGIDGGAGAVGSASKMWIAFDDENLVGKKLSYYWPEGGRPNDLLTANAYSMLHDTLSSSANGTTTPTADRGGHMQVDDNSGFAVARYSYTAKALVGHPIGLPSVPEYVDKIWRVEMAELQIFTGVSLNTGETPNRRAFVGKDGKPVSPTQKQEKDGDGNITKYSGSIELLRQQPVILLHGSTNWKKGYNTGASAGQVVVAGKKQKPDQLTPVGGIERYTPDPSLRGDQGKPSAKPP